jgi:hypothetical protein
MKKLLLSVMMFAGVAVAANAQTTGANVNGSKGDVVDDAHFEKLHAKYPWVFSRYTNTTNKRAEVTGWYSYADAARDAGITWTNITNTSLFPDSTVYQLYGAEGGGTELGFVGLHNIGQTFDPKYEFFSDPAALNRFNNYKVDSIGFFYRYAYNKQGTTDTLRIQFYQNGQVTPVTFGGSGGSSLSVQYNWQTNRSTSPNFSREIEILLDGDDTTGDESGDAKLMSIAVPGGGLNVNANRYCAFTMTYHPGYEYNFGDTLEHDWEETEVVNKLNHFRPNRYRDGNKFPDASGNVGLFIQRSNRYNLEGNGWANLFVPGEAFFDQNDHLYALFYITGFKVGVDDITNGYGLGNAYPNPATANSTLNVDFTLGNAENVTVELVNAIGVKVATAVENQNFAAGESTVSFDLANVAAGVYFYKITAGEYTATKKVIVQ